MQRASCVSFSLLGRVRLSSASLALSLFDRRIHARVFSLLYLYSVVERRMKEEYARKIHKTHESVGRRAFVCVFLFFEISFSSRSTFFICSKVLFLPCLFAVVQPKNLNFSHHVLKRRERRPLLLSKKDKKTQHHPAVSYKKKFILVSNELSSSPPSPHKIKGKRHASSPSNDDDDVDSRDLQMLLLLCVVVVVVVVVFSVFFED